MTASSERNADQVVTVRRLIRAPRAFLFRAWTDPASFAKWFGPKGWTVNRCDVDARAGGCWRAWFRRQNGSIVFVSGIYSEVEPDRRIVFTWDTTPEGGAPEPRSVVTVEFRDVEDRVEVNITHRELSTGQAVDMDVGWNSTLDSLEEYVRTEQ